MTSTNPYTGLCLSPWHQHALKPTFRHYAGALPGARAHYDRQRARGTGHNAALRHLANRLVGILHGCLKTGTRYDEDTAWAHHQNDLELAA